MPQADRFHHPFLPVGQDYKTGLGGLNLARGNRSAPGGVTSRSAANGACAAGRQVSGVPRNIPGSSVSSRNYKGHPKENTTRDVRTEPLRAEQGWGGRQMNLHGTSSE